MKSKLISQMQDFVAETCIGASALRGKGRKGLTQKAREFFKIIDLRSIPKEEKNFAKWLDGKTEELLDKWERSQKTHFALARKALNLFLRSAAYTSYLNRSYNLDSVLPLLEVPLDSYTAKHLKFHIQDLPEKWDGLKSLSNDNHDKYQRAALQLAKQWEMNRVDLDVYFFREEVRKT